MPRHTPHRDAWHYFDPNGKEYDQTEFTAYIDANFPRRYDGDYETGARAERRLLEREGWRRERQTYLKPPLEEIAGKYLVVSQFSEPRYNRWDETKRDWVQSFHTYHDYDQVGWETMGAEIWDERIIRWGHSTWLIEADGRFTWVGADYDSSG